MSVARRPFLLHGIIAFALVLVQANILPGAIPGDLDPEFGTAGRVITAMGQGGDAVAHAIAIQGDGKILVAGHALNVNGDRDFALARYTTTGELDTTFGSGGRVITPIGSGEDSAHGVVVQPNGSIVMAGYSFNGTHNDFAVVRYTASGALDTTFSADGMVTTKVGTNLSEARRVALQSDGKIVVAGTAFTGSNFDIAVVRYTNAGALDTTFSGDGKMTVDVGGGHDQGEDLVVQSTAKITVCGMSHNGTYYDAAVVRLNANGTLDTTFSSDGKVTTSLGSGGDTIGWDMALTADGKYLVAGEAWNGADQDMALVRYTSTGAIDAGFGTGGTLMIGSWREEYAVGVALQPDGKILTTGTIDYLGTSFLLTRLTASGNWDSSFNAGNSVITSFDTGDSAGLALAVQSDGRIISAGYVTDSSTGARSFALVRYTVHTSATATTLAAEDVTTSSATLRAMVNPNGVPTTVIFEYGTTTAYGNTASITLSDPTGTEFQYVTAPLTGLQEGATYHYRVTAQTGSYTVHGEDITFTTPVEVEIQMFAGPGDTGTELTDGQAAAVDFGSTPLGQPVTRVFTVKNSGSSNLVLGAPMLSSGWEISTGAFQTLNLPGGGSHTFEVRFLANTVKGAFTGSLSVPSNDVDEPVFDLNFTARTLIGGNAAALDTSFGGTGKVVTYRLNGDSGNAVALQPDGKILVAGECTVANARRDFAVLRYHVDGTLDTSFGTDGWAITQVGIGNNDDAAWDVAMQPDGKIVVAGYISYTGASPDFVLLRYLSNGQLDTGFGSGGRVIMDISPNSTASSAFCLALQNDGKIVVAGSVGGALALARCHSNGSLDNSFGTGGKVWTPLNDGRIWDIAITSDGKIVAAGHGAQPMTFNRDFMLARYTAAGVLDTTLGGSGVVLTPFGPGNDEAHALAVQPDGSLLLAGHASNGSNNDFAMARFHADGTLDTSFGTEGKVMTPIGTGDEANDMLLQDDGRIVLVGMAHVTTRRFALARYLSDGTLDTSFGPGGTMTTALGTHDFAYGVVQQPDGKLVVAGTAWVGSGTDFAVVRYGGDLAPTVVTLNANPVTSSSAALTGTVNPHGVLTQVWFEYGTTAAYGSTTAPQDVGYGAASVDVSAPLGGLSIGTTYHFRLVAQTGEGITRGEDMTFGTLPGSHPSGGGMIAPASALAGSTISVQFTGWRGDHPPFTYTVLIEDTVVSPAGTATSREVPAPMSPGTHILKGRITDAQLSFTEVFRNLVVTTPHQAYASTLADAGLHGSDAEPTASPHRVGVANLLKYAFNMKLFAPDSSFMAQGGSSGLPSLSTQPASGTTLIFRYEFLRRTDSGLVYTPQRNANLTNPDGWMPLNSTPTVIAVSPGWERVIHEESYDSSVTPTCFGRVLVTLPGQP